MLGESIGVLCHLVGELADGVSSAGVGDEEVVDLVIRVVKDESVLRVGFEAKFFGGEGELVGDGSDADGVGVDSVGGVVGFGELGESVGGGELGVLERLSGGIEEMDGGEAASAATFDELRADFIKTGLEFDLDIGLLAPPVGGGDDGDSVVEDFDVAVLDGEDGPLFVLRSEEGAKSAEAGVLGGFGKAERLFLAFGVGQEPVFEHGISGDGEDGDFRGLAGESAVTGVGEDGGEFLRVISVNESEDGCVGLVVLLKVGDGLDDLGSDAFV